MTVAGAPRSPPQPALSHREDVELAETRKRQVAELETSLAEVKATAAAAAAEDEAAQLAAVDRLNEHDMEVAPALSTAPTSTLTLARPHADHAAIKQDKPQAASLCWNCEPASVLCLLQEYHVMKILLGNKLEAMEQQFEDIHKVCPGHRAVSHLHLLYTQRALRCSSVLLEAYSCTGLAWIGTK